MRWTGRPHAWLHPHAGKPHTQPGGRAGEKKKSDAALLGGVHAQYPDPLSTDKWLSDVGGGIY